MPDNEFLMQELRRLIGLRVRYHGAEYQVIEALRDGPALVLRDAGDATSIQANQYGEACRRVPRTELVPVLTPDKDGLAPAFLELDVLGHGNRDAS